MTDTNNKDQTPKGGSLSTRERQLTHRLILKSVAMFGSVVLILLSVATLIISRDATVDTEARMMREITRLRDVLVMTMLDGAEKKRERTEYYLSTFARDSLIHEVRIFSVDTVIAFSSDTSEVGTKLDLGSAPLCRDCHNSAPAQGSTQSEYIDSLGERHRHFVFPIPNAPACQSCHDDGESKRGAMVVDFSLSAIDKSSSKTRYKLIGLIIILLAAFTTLIYALLTRAVYHPLVVIAQRLEGISKGAFGDPQDRRDRSGKNIMNHLHNQIDETSKQLEASYERLEGEVRARTKLLRDSQEALGKERNKLQLILDGAPNGIIEADNDGVITFANSRIEAIVGLEAKDVVGKLMTDFPILERVYIGSAVTRVRDNMEMYKIVLGSELVDLNIDGQGKRHIDVSATCVETVEGPHALLIMLVDSTFEREVEAHLEHHDRLAAIGQLAAGVAHEVGNPLSAISTIAQLMKQSLEGEDERTHLDLIAYHIDRINRIVRGLSGFSRTPTDRLVSATVSSIIEAALEITKFDSRASSVEFRVEYPENERKQELPQDSLMQAFINIIMNALDVVQNQESPRIAISVTQDAKETVARIADNGPGVEESAMKHLIEPFYTTKSEGDGTGLGLFITHKIVTGVDGTLDVESTLGEGATFIITIPLKSMAGEDGSTE